MTIKHLVLSGGAYKGFYTVGAIKYLSSIKFYDKGEVDYSKNNLNEVGKLVQEDFEYRSDNNKHFLSCVCMHYYYFF